MKEFWNELSSCRLGGCSIRSLTVKDSGKIFEFLRENGDFFELENGRAPVESDGRAFIDDLPPNKLPSDKFNFCIIHNNQIVALVDVVRDYPDDHIWWIGLLLIHPSYRGTGLGGRIYRLLEHLVCSMRGKEIRLGVLAENEPALHFWKRMGFTQILTKHGMKIGEKSHTVHVFGKQLEQSDDLKNRIF